MTQLISAQAAPALRSVVTMIAVAPVSLADLRFGITIHEGSNHEPRAKRQKDRHHHRLSPKQRHRQRLGLNIVLSNAVSWKLRNAARAAFPTMRDCAVKRRLNSFEGQ
jgi:hypothetical protein